MLSRNVIRPSVCADAHLAGFRRGKLRMRSGIAHAAENRRLHLIRPYGSWLKIPIFGVALMADHRIAWRGSFQAASVSLGENR